MRTKNIEIVSMRIKDDSNVYTFKILGGGGLCHYDTRKLEQDAVHMSRKIDLLCLLVIILTGYPMKYLNRAGEILDYQPI